MILPLDEIIFEEEPHTYTFRGRQFLSVTQVIRLAGLGPDFSRVPEDRLEYAQRRGVMVHKACHYYDEGDLALDSIDAAIRGYVEAYIAFRAIKTLKVIASEKRMVEAATLNVAGTPDLVCWMNGRRAVVDRKTSQTMTKSMGIQTAGYKLLWNWTHPISERVQDRFGLRLGKNGVPKLIPHNDPDDELAFLDALRFAKVERNMQPWREKYGH